MPRNHPGPAGAHRAEHAAADRERRARRTVLDRTGVDVDPRPWRPAPVPPSAVDVLQLAAWWGARRPAPDPARATGTDPAAGTVADTAAHTSPSPGTVAGTSPDADDDAREVALAALALLPAARAELDQLETALLLLARSAGLTWGRMAEALGLGSPQACQQRSERLAQRTAGA